MPLRFYLDAGTNEIDPSGQGADTLLTNRNLRDMLRAKGYEVHYQEFEGDHDPINGRGTLADGLIAFLGKLTTQFLRNVSKPEGIPSNAIRPQQIHCFGGK